MKQNIKKTPNLEEIKEQGFKYSFKSSIGYKVYVNKNKAILYFRSTDKIVYEWDNWNTRKKSNRL